MGKKSKKKGGGGGAASKAARKEKLQERREQQLEQLDQYSDDDGDNNNENRRAREYFVGDRVWFRTENYWNGDNPNTYRGIVQSVDGDFVDVKPLQEIIDGGNYTERISIKTTYPDSCVLPDFCDMTLRFDAGDQVVCSYDEWEPAVVEYLWPTGKMNHGSDHPLTAAEMVPHYKCFLAFSNESVQAPEDNDKYIKMRPTSFWFKVGDRVVFDPAMVERASSAAAVNYLQRNNTSWIRGEVTEVDMCAAGRSYAAYECSFHVGTKIYSCSIWDDDDESIALADADPRKRLFDAIEQDCSRLHFISH